MARQRWGPVQKAVFEDTCTPEILEKSVPGMADILEGAQQMRDVNNEINVLGRLRRKYPDMSPPIAKIDTNMMLLLDHLHEAACTCSKPLWGADGHKQWFYSWLDGPGKAFDVRAKVIL